MVLDRIQQLAHQVTTTTPLPYPLDPLSTIEIDTAVSIVRSQHGNLNFNAVSLYEPRKANMMAWLEDPSTAARPMRAADVVAIDASGKVYDGVVDLGEKRIVSWENTEGVQPLITMEDLQEVEHIVRRDERVIEQCGILGIPKEDMGKVYCDREFSFFFSKRVEVLIGCSVDNWIR